MKFAVTGHTSGLGAALGRLLASRGYAWVGLSRSTGHDIRTERAAILAAARDCDVFVNNAYAGFAQTELLYELWQEWRDLPRIIVNLGSRSGDHTQATPSPYKVHKKTLADATRQLQLSGHRCRLVCVKPSLMDTPMVAHRTDDKLEVDRVAQLILWVVEQPSGLWITEIGMTAANSGPRRG